MNKPQINAAKARLQQLRAIPERDRTDAEWDELHELEISLAPANRENAPPIRQNRQIGPMRLPGAGMPGQPRPGGRAQRKFHKRHKPRPA